MELILARGSFNRSKFKVLVLLDDVWQQSQQKTGSDYWLSIKRLAIFTGIPYYSLGSLLRRYVSFGYITSRACGGSGEGQSEYTITAKGRRWLQRAESYLRAAPQFRQELETRINKTLPLVDGLSKLPFKDFLVALKELDALIQLWYQE